MFIYCFDEHEKNKLLNEKQLKLHQETNIDDKKCWIFVADQGGKINFNEVDKSKCLMTNKMMFV